MEPSTGDAPGVEQREGYLGGSDAAAILGLSPYATPFSVFLQKKGLNTERRFDDATLEKFAFGHAMEPVIAAQFEKRMGLVTKRPSAETAFIRSKQYPFLAGHLDYWVLRDGDKYPHALLECKNIERRGEWGEPDPTGRSNPSAVAVYYLAQCDHYMALTDLNICYLAVLFGGCRLEVYPIMRSVAREGVLLEALSRFWKHIEGDDPPSFMGTVDDITLALQARYLASVNADEAKKSKTIIQVTGEAAVLLDQVKKARRAESAAKKESHAAQGALLKLLEGQTGYLQVGDEKWGSFLMQDRTTFDDFALQMEHPEIYAKYQSTKRIGPVLRLRKDESEESNAEKKNEPSMPARTVAPENDDCPF